MLQRNAINILKFILKSPSILRLEGRLSKEEEAAISEMESHDDVAIEPLYFEADKDTQEIVIDGALLHATRGESDVFEISLNESGAYKISFVLKSDLISLAQLPISIFCNNIFKTTLSIQGTEGRTIVKERELGFLTNENNNYIRLYYGANGVEIEKIVIKPIADR